MILFKIYCFYSLPNEIKMYGISIVMNEIERVHQIKIKIKNEIESTVVLTIWTWAWALCCGSFICLRK